MKKKSIFQHMPCRNIQSQPPIKEKKALYKVPNQLRNSSNIHDKLNKSPFKFQ